MTNTAILNKLEAIGASEAELSYAQDADLRSVVEACEGDLHEALEAIKQGVNEARQAIR